MNPILLGRQVAESLKDLVRSSLSTTSPMFDGMVETFLDRPKNYLQGPWVSVDMPFHSAESSDEPFPEVPLGFRPHRHQELAFGRLGGTQPKSTLIATGTGSGKTESYLWPILDHCRRHKGEPGIKAILIYPMNALATDQARRIAKAIHGTPSLKGIRSGIYADKEPNNAVSEMSATDIITKRSSMWDAPPDILLTNYKMLDYLLLRGRDRNLWAQNEATTLQFLVVDEIHTFDGAQGADLALLIRRLKDRLNTPEGHLACVGSSATLGSGDDAARRLTAYASEIFGEAFGRDAIIRESRKEPRDVLPVVDTFDVPDASEVQTALLSSVSLDQPSAAVEVARAFFPKLDPAHDRYDPLLPPDASSFEWRYALGIALKGHAVVQRVLAILAANNGPASIEAVAADLGKSKSFHDWETPALHDLAEAVVSLISWARAGTRSRPQPLFSVRVQYWAREMVRMVSSVGAPLAGSEAAHSRLAHSDDLEPLARRQYLPMVHCSSCGSTGHLGRRSTKGFNLWAPTETIYSDFFDDANRLRTIYYQRISREGVIKGPGQVITGHLEPSGLEFHIGQHTSTDVEDAVPVWLYDPTDGSGKFDRTCPACGTPQSLTIFGLRGARITSALVDTIYTSAHNEEDENEKPRLLMFSDSVQDAAQAAAVAEIRNSANVWRKSLYQAVAMSETAGLTLEQIFDELPAKLLEEEGPDSFVAKYIDRDQVWRSQYKDLTTSGVLGERGKILEHVQLRLGWEFFSDLTYRAYSSKTLESGQLVLADVSPDIILSRAEQLPEKIRAHVSPSIDLTAREAGEFLSGLLQHMRRRGAVAHPYLQIAMEKNDRGRGPNFYAAARLLGLGKTNALPTPNFRRSPAPTPPTLRKDMDGYQNVDRDHPSNWYRAWADRFILEKNPLATSIYPDLFAYIFQDLEAASIVRRVASEADIGKYGFLLEPSAILVSSRVQNLRCDACDRSEIAFEGDNNLRHGAPCTRIGCSGHMAHDERRENPHLARLMSSPWNHRVVAREHTGMLNPEDRRLIETRFIAGSEAWDPNLISATPTLEMGIDIGDLSTLVLRSVPPEQSNYVQRVGRTGRRDGNSLNITIANARPHDLQFWADPQQMLSGKVRPPGVHLGAVAVLRRQAAAFSLDRWVASDSAAGEYGEALAALASLDRGRGDAFPLGWFEYIGRNGSTLAEDFVSMLARNRIPDARIAEAITQFLAGDSDETLIWKVRGSLDDLRRQKDALLEQSKALDNQRRKLLKQGLPPKDLEDQINAIKADKAEIGHLIRSINKTKSLEHLIDTGILPNYAFPEEGVKLTSVLIRQKGEDGETELKTIDYVRPAASALSEFAPFQYFYADGNEIQIDRLDLGKSDLANYRFCQNCSHVEREAAAKSHNACPRCGDAMWDDLGSSREVAELKGVMATTAESVAGIKDADDRNSQRFDRALFPQYEKQAVEFGYASSGQGRSTPFGFEFIDACDIRDFNFGTMADGPVGAVIAGEPRRSHAFRICRHCGKAQHPPRQNKPEGDHQARCQVLEEKSDRGEWEARVFLMREFRTEAIRMVIPVVGDVTPDEIKSFVAGIEMGLRLHFAGRVDHIRSTVVEEQVHGLVRIKSFYLYDTVPGGSGYLRQLVENPASLRNVISLAAEGLRDCPCNHEGLDGCYRCVLSYRSQFGPGTPSRDNSLRLMEEILQHWDHLRETDADMNETIGAELVESHLEQRFLDKLRATFGTDSLKPKLLDGVRRAFQLTVRNEGSAPAYWTIETQVQMDVRFPRLPRKRVDFLMTPAGGQSSMPVVVEMDGLAFHAKTAATDLNDRLLMIRSRKVRVFSLAWDDVADTLVGSVPNPFSSERLGTDIEPVLQAFLGLCGLMDKRPWLKQLQDATSWEGLLGLIRQPSRDLGRVGAILILSAIGRGNSLELLPRINNLMEDGKVFLAEVNKHGFLTDRTLDVYLGAPDGTPKDAADNIAGFRIVARAELPKLNGEIVQNRNLSEAWRGLWRVVNFLQDLPGFHIEFEGLDTLSAPDPNAAADQDRNDGWLAVEALVDPAFMPLVLALRSAKVPAPRTGLDVMLGDTVVGMFELAWPIEKVGVTEDAFESPDWTSIRFDPEAGQDLDGTVKAIIRLLEGIEQ